MKNFNIKDKIVFLRADFNVPLNAENEITDSTRVDKTLDTILVLSNGNNKLIVASHLARPAGFDKKYSMTPVYKYLQEKLSQKVHFYKGFDSQLKDYINNNVEFGEIVLLENLRFDPGEEVCSEEFMKLLSSCADVYINDAFASSHRAHASIMLNKYFAEDKKFYGPLLEKELYMIGNFLQKTDGSDDKTLAIIGGSKISTKIKLIERLVQKVDCLFIAGAMANTVLDYQGCQIGKSLCESEQEETISNIFRNARESGCEVIVPCDFVTVSGSVDNVKSKRVINMSNLLPQDIILDCGPRTIESVATVMNQSNKVVWNGPLGMFEREEFASGTYSLARLISNLTRDGRLESIIGGGDTIAAINKLPPGVCFFSHICTAGGAFLEYIENDLKLIGLWKNINNHTNF